jgi:hypothetical protein
MHVVINPNSLTNDTPSYRVADYADWVKVTNGDATDYPYTPHDTYDAAAADANARNATAVTPA